MSDPTIDDINRAGLDLLERIRELTCSIEEDYALSCGLISCKLQELETRIQELERINARREYKNFLNNLTVK